MAKATASAGGEAGRFIRFQISGGIGTALFFLAYDAMFQHLQSNPLRIGSMEYKIDNPSGFSWAVCYLLSISWQYVLHQLIVFDRTFSARGLVDMYAAYVGGLALSTVVNYGLSMVVNHRVAWGLTLASTGYINYKVVCWFQARRGKTPEQRQHSA
eukprot:tig00000367_g24478.t1